MSNTIDELRKKIIRNQYYNSKNEYNEFKQDALVAVGLENHAKKDKAYSLAWEYGHSSGYDEVLTYLQDIAELMK